MGRAAAQLTERPRRAAKRRTRKAAPKIETEPKAGAAAWTFACPDWERRLLAGESLIPDLPLDEARAAQATRIFDKLRLPDVVGQPALGVAAGGWFRDIVRVLFGSLDDDGVRHVSEIFALVAKKNSKTTYSAALMVVALLMNDVPRGEFLFVAPTQEIADEAFNQASGMIECDADGYLQKRFHVADHKKTITDRRNKAILKIKTFDMRVMTGSRPIGVLLDELHVMGSIHYAANVIGQIRGALQNKPSGFLLSISTQSDKPPAGIFRTELTYARRVRDGDVAGGRLLPILYEFPEEMQTDPARPWMDPRYWRCVSPNMGRSVSLDGMKAGLAEAVEKGEEEFRRWASQHLNVQIGLALHSDRWRGADYWEAAGAPALADLDGLLDRCEVVTVGVDGGGLDDLYGLAVLGRDRETSEWLLWCRAWVQSDVLDLRKDVAPALRDFAAAGDLVLCQGATEDVDGIADIVARIFARGLLPEKFGVGLDPVGVAALIDALAERGVEVEANGGPVCAVYQGYKLSGAVWGMERKLKDGTLRHAGRPMMAWCVGNAKTEQRGNAVLITKQAAGKAKIDPLIAAFNAFALMSRGPVAGCKIDYQPGQMFGRA